MIKRTRKATPKQNRIYMLRTMLLLLGIALFFAVGGGILYVKNQTQMSTYTSEFMKIQFLYPNKYLIRDSVSAVVLTKNRSDDARIIATESGTNSTDVTSHVDNSLLRKRTKPSIRRSIVGENITGEMVEYKEGREPYRIYYFVKNYSVYQFEANDPTLFSDLDAIVKSFRILD